jgi:signal transduction histidine kinase/CheY-like chemotaxis protein
MKIKPDANTRARRNTVYVSLVFLILAVSLQALVWLYWNKILEPRLRREAASQADVLAHAQEIRLVDAILAGREQRLQTLNETMDEILLFTGPASDEPLFLGLDLEIDYAVVDAPGGSLDQHRGANSCHGCFLSEVGLYSPRSDELIGIARFRVSDRLYRELSRDVSKTLFNQSHLGTLLLLMVWAVVMYLIREINRSRQQAEAANRAKSAFLANMSHELRTPLNAIIGFSELMGFDTGISEKQKESLAIINRSGEYLLELINDVLELSKIEASGDTLAETAFDLYDALEKVTEMIRLRAEKKNLQLIFERADNVPRYIRTDERKLRQILLNLLGNAVKFTQEGGVTLRVQSARDERTINGEDMILLHFEVEDSGPGIPLQDRARIFEAFTQSQSGYDKKEGTGLGLSISRQFVRHLGGDIKAGGAEGKGAVFQFTIRVAPSQAVETESHVPERRVIGLEPGQEDGRIQPYRILAVDDNAENRALLKLLLERVGFRVQTAENGRQAVELSRQWRPHLIWMDMRMPVMDGYEATRTIRREAADQQTTPPVIIALTASAFNEDRAAVFAAGCDDFVRRPFRESEIFSKIQEHLGVAYTYDPFVPASARSASSCGFPDGAFKADLTRLPRRAVTELKTAIELSDMDRMGQVVDEIGAGHEALADGLRELVDTFQFDRLLAFLDGVGRTSSESQGEVE